MAISKRTCWFLGRYREPTRVYSVDGREVGDPVSPYSLQFRIDIRIQGNEFKYI